MKTGKKSWNRNQIKYLVIVAMLIDHIAWAFVPDESVLGQIMHFIGRLTGPTMAYFLVEGYIHTGNVKKYAFRLGIFALISWIPFCLFEFQRLPIAMVDGKWCFTPFFGVIYTLFLGLLAVWLLDKGKCPKYCKVLGIIGLCILSVFGDWPIFDILYAVIFFVYRNNTRKKWIFFSIITSISVLVPFFIVGFTIWGIYQLGIFMVPVIMLFFYNGESGSKKPIHKWFFYVFYPLHLLVLGILQMM